MVVAEAEGLVRLCVKTGADSAGEVVEDDSGVTSGLGVDAGCGEDAATGAEEAADVVADVSEAAVTSVEVLSDCD